MAGGFRTMMAGVALASVITAAEAGRLGVSVGGIGVGASIGRDGISAGVSTGGLGVGADVSAGTGGIGAGASVSTGRTSANVGASVGTGGVGASVGVGSTGTGGTGNSGGTGGSCGSGGSPSAGKPDGSQNSTAASRLASMSSGQVTKTRKLCLHLMSSRSDADRGLRELCELLRTASR